MPHFIGLMARDGSPEYTIAYRPSENLEGIFKHRDEMLEYPEVDDYKIFRLYEVTEDTYEEFNENLYLINLKAEMSGCFSEWNNDNIDESEDNTFTDIHGTVREYDYYTSCLVEEGLSKLDIFLGVGNIDYKPFYFWKKVGSNG